MYAKRKLYVVSERFKDYFKMPYMISLQNLENMIKNTFQSKEFIYDVYFGQGNNINKILDLTQYIAQNKLSNIYNFIVDHSYQKATQLLTHKHKVKNILITDPHLKNDGYYESYVMIDDRCDDMKDHTTGLHISGMLLIEATRQMATAVTEKFFLENSKEKLSFVTDTLEVKFNNFIHPFTVKMLYKINKIRGVGSNKSFDVTISIIQNDIICADVRYIFTIFCFDYLENRQMEMALKAVECIFNDGTDE
jgi:hypothetical protein